MWWFSSNLEVLNAENSDAGTELVWLIYLLLELLPLLHVTGCCSASYLFHIFRSSLISHRGSSYKVHRSKLLSCLPLKLLDLEEENLKSAAV